MKLWQIPIVVGLGILYGLIAPGRLAYALGHATLYVFLPALLFEAAWNLNYRAVRRNWPAIATLAGPGTLLTAAIVAGALAIVHVPLGAALLAGAVLSATDPISVVAVFRRLKIARTLATIVECESLFNDAVAVTVYRAVLVTIALGSVSAARLAVVSLEALAGAAGGIAIGMLVAFMLARLLRRSRAGTQVAATVVCAYGAYFAAEYLHCAGIFSTIAFAMALRRYERAWIALSIEDGVDRFWQFAAFVANALVFFLVGAGLELGRVVLEPIFTIACIAGIAVARFAIAGLLSPFPYPRRWLGVVRVAGMRGALSLALALALPASIPYREAIVDATFAVVLVTLAASSLTIVPIVRRLPGRQIPSG